jgi:hypothetical protein
MKTDSRFPADDPRPLQYKTVRICIIAFILFFIPALFILKTVRCIVVRAHEDQIVFIMPVKDGDAVTLSHKNSIYDAPVDEHLEVRGNSLKLRKVVTDSNGVMEYYGIADGTPHGEWSIIRVFATGEREFSLIIRGVTVDAFKERKNTHFIIELIRFPLYRFVLWKLHIFI